MSKSITCGSCNKQRDGKGHGEVHTYHYGGMNTEIGKDWFCGDCSDELYKADKCFDCIRKKPVDRCFSCKEMNGWLGKKKLPQQVKSKLLS